MCINFNPIDPSFYIKIFETIDFRIVHSATDRHKNIHQQTQNRIIKISTRTQGFKHNRKERQEHTNAPTFNSCFHCLHKRI